LALRADQQIKGSLEWIEKLLVEYLKEKGFLDG